MAKAAGVVGLRKRRELVRQEKGFFMTPSPKVSIITPSYNQALYLEECIRSVLEQDYPNIEYIIMDGGSTDGSVEIIRKYADRLAYWVSERDAGQSAAINSGLRRSTGEIWAWMNSDDAYLPGAVSKAVAWLEAHPDQEIVFGDCEVVDENGRKLQSMQPGEFSLAAMLQGGNGIPSGSTFLRRSVRDRIGVLEESFHYLMDIDYWFRAGQVCTFGHIPETLSLYRVYSGAKTWDPAQSEKRAREYIRMYEAFWGRADHPNEIRPLRARSLAKAYLYAADLVCQGNNRELSFQYIRSSLKMGLPALRPRLARVLLQLLFGGRVASSAQRLWRSIRPDAGSMK
jgi:glycosyltransferase involved in cell wall biosynthesis